MSETEQELTPSQVAALKRRRLVEAYRHTFEDTESGIIVLAEMELSLGRRPSFVKDPYLTAFHEGQRSVYLQMREMILEAKQPPPEARTVDTREQELPEWLTKT